MSQWHRENPELTGTDADPWMEVPGHAEAALEVRQARAGFSDAWIEEQERLRLTFDCDACGADQSIACEWDGRDYVADCSECGLSYEYDPDPPGALHERSRRDVEQGG
jgi:hypothetical protein